jgi:hypothetical protein
MYKKKKKKNVEKGCDLETTAGKYFATPAPPPTPHQKKKKKKKKKKKERKKDARSPRPLKTFFKKKNPFRNPRRRQAVI